MFAAILYDAVVAALTINLRYTTVLFVRHYPIGPKYLHMIYTNTAVYLLSAAAQWGLAGPQARKRKRNPLMVALLGWIDLTRPVLSALTVLLNVLCLVASVDFVYRAHFLHPSTDLSFARVGHVDTTSARIVIRAPNATAVELQLQPQSQASTQAAASGTVVDVSAEDDFVATFVLEGLSPDTEYLYHTNASHQGTFHTTSAHLKKWTMVSTSCIKPFYPYNPADHGLRVKGLEYLSQFVSKNAVDFVLFLGDFIYIDLPYPLGWTRDDYTTAYRQVYASPSWSQQLQSLPWVHVYDDHEIINDWSANETGLYKDAIHPFWNYQGKANPVSNYGDDESYYTFRHGDVSFFVMDTRRYRSDSAIRDGPGKTMLGEAQLRHLRDWLIMEPSWKVVVSSVPFTRNWRGPDFADSWSGYMWEREIVLDLMRRTSGVVILSGDRHEHATTIFPPKEKGRKSIIEFSTSALNQFFEPFNRFHKEIEETDVAVHNHYKGNSKFAAVTFDTSEPGRWLTHFQLIIDGETTWTYDWTYEK